MGSMSIQPVIYVNFLSLVSSHRSAAVSLLLFLLLRLCGADCGQCNTNNHHRFRTIAHAANSIVCVRAFDAMLCCCCGHSLWNMKRKLNMHEIRLYFCILLIAHSPSPPLHLSVILHVAYVERKLFRIFAHIATVRRHCSKEHLRKSECNWAKIVHNISMKLMYAYDGRVEEEQIIYVRVYYGNVTPCSTTQGIALPIIFCAFCSSYQISNWI